MSDAASELETETRLRRSPPETETRPRRWLHQPKRDVQISRRDRGETFVAFYTVSRKNRTILFLQ